MSQLLPIPESLAEPESRVVARRFSEMFEAEKLEEVRKYHRFHHAFWSNYRVTPDEILQRLDTAALRFLLIVRAKRTFLEALAALDNLTLADLIGTAFANPPRAFIPEFVAGAPTGRVTLADPADGHDAWGRPIPVEPEPGEGEGGEV